MPNETSFLTQVNLRETRSDIVLNSHISSYLTMRILNTFILLIQVLIGCSQTSTAKENAHMCDWRLGISGSFISGGEFNSNSFDYVIGQGVYVSMAHPVSDRLAISGNGGIEILTDETFYPLFASFMIQPSPSKKYYVHLDLGHSFAEHKNYERQTSYEFKGGRLTGIGIASCLQLGGQSILHIGATLKHQLTRLSYSGGNGFNYQDRLNYILLSFTAGLHF